MYQNSGSRQIPFFKIGLTSYLCEAFLVATNFACAERRQAITSQNICEIEVYFRFLWLLLTSLMKCNSFENNAEEEVSRSIVNSTDNWYLLCHFWTDFLKIKQSRATLYFCNTKVVLIWEPAWSEISSRSYHDNVHITIMFIPR